MNKSLIEEAQNRAVMLEHLELFFKSIFIDNMAFAVFLGDVLLFSRF